jgi:hypothetical protein
MSPARNLLYGQLLFFCCLTLCVLIVPQGVSSNNGWSYYGGDPKTIAPYALGFLGCAFFASRAAAALDAGPHAPRGLGPGLRALVAFFLLDLLTPDVINSFFYVAHIVASVFLFVAELAYGAWLVRLGLGGRTAVVLLGIQFAGGIVAMLSEVQWLGVLSAGILVFQAAFAALLVVATRDFPPAPTPVPMFAWESPRR